MLRALALACGFVLISSANLPAAPPKILEFRTQEVGPHVYFQVVLEKPDDMRLDRHFRWGHPAELRQLPRLVSQDAATRSVHLHVVLLTGLGGGDSTLLELPRLEFVGRLHGEGPAKLLLQYLKPSPKANETTTLAQLLKDRRAWLEETIDLDFNLAVKVPIPVARRDPSANPRDDDLEGRWAVAQVNYFRIQERLTPDFAFHALARESTARRYGVPPANFSDPRATVRDINPDRRTYELTTGASAIAESLALHRFRNPGDRRDRDRVIDVKKLQGIDIAEHPWEKMMAGKKPDPEPLARLVPHDNYYVHFKNIAKFLETGDLLDQWGGTAASAYEISSRDYRVKQRLEQQLCLKSTLLTRRFGPAVVKSLAVTGSDPYIREGADVTVIFHVKNLLLFRAAVDPHLEEAKKKFPDLESSKSEHRGIVIETHATPLREVSLSRATIGDFVIYGNSVVGVRRIIDTHKGLLKPLADALDFQYMRTVFRLEDPAEDGFVFFSDAFIRHVVGPSLRIKERRRLEAITSMHMIHHGALFTAWELGELPVRHDVLLNMTGLTQADLFTPDGAGVVWNPVRGVAHCDVYNTMHFATPLIELPIDQVTWTEAAEYETFRREYLGLLWRQFFDPVGMRLSLRGDEIRWETYILPLIQSSGYNELRQLTGNGVMKLDLGSISDQTLLQLFFHFSPQARERQFLENMANDNFRLGKINWLGDWVTVRLDDTAAFGKLLERRIREEIDPNYSPKRFWDELNLIFQVPIAVGVEIRNPLVFAGVLTMLRQKVMDSAGNFVTWEPMKEPYKGVSIVRFKANDNFNLPLNRDNGAPTVYYVTMGGAFYLATQVEPIRDLIDKHLARKGNAPGGAVVEVNQSAHISPAAAKKAKAFVHGWLEWETHRRALDNTRILHALHRGKLIGPDDTAASADAKIFRMLGFVPVSPDNEPYRYDAKNDEVVNRRHGTSRMPDLHPAIGEASPLAKMLDQFATIRADLRFREDGIHTIVTLKRGK